MSHQAQFIQTYPIYQDPSDYPGKFVLRKWTSDHTGARPDPEPLAVVDTLEEARAALPAGLYNLGRAPGDDSVLVEVWI